MAASSPAGEDARVKGKSLVGSSVVANAPTPLVLDRSSEDGRGPLRMSIPADQAIMPAIPASSLASMRRLKCEPRHFAWPPLRWSRSDWPGRPMRPVGCRSTSVRPICFHRIDQGVRNGGLTRPEAERLRDRFWSIARMEHRYRRTGHDLTWRERADLDRRFDSLSRSIHFQRHDRQRR
jgi:hypothetical protein